MFGCQKYKGIALREEEKKLIHNSTSSEPILRLKAAWELGEFMHTSEESIKNLHILLNDDHIDVRGTAIEALGKIGQINSQAVDIILPFLDIFDESDFCARAAYALGRAGKNAKKAIPRLIKAIDSKEDETIRWPSIWALGEIGLESEEILQALCRGLMDSEGGIRWVSLSALARFGVNAFSVTSEIACLLNDRHQMIRFEAEKVLHLISGKKNWNYQFTERNQEVYLFNHSKFNSDELEKEIYRFGEKGKQYDEGFNNINQFLAHRNISVQGTTAEAIGKLGVENERALDVLIKYLETCAIENKGRTAWAIGWIGQVGVKAVPILRKTIESLAGISHREIEARWAALWALGKIAKSVPGIEIFYVTALKDLESDIRFIAAENLGNLGIFNEQVSSALQIALNDRHYIVRQRACLALEKLNSSI
jgi:HEAT repeat protein